jgi:hypothetical protein
MLVEAAKVLMQEAEAVDAEVAEEWAAYETALRDFTSVTAGASGRDSQTQAALSVDSAHSTLQTASSKYVAARHAAFLKLSAHELCARANFQGREGRDATLTAKRSTGVDAWVRFLRYVYAMQCKGQESGIGAGRPGNDVTFEPAEVDKVIRVFGKWLQKPEIDAERVIALELLTTKRMTTASRRRAAKEIRPVVLIARDTMLPALGLVFGGIAARCKEELTFDEKQN